MKKVNSIFTFAKKKKRIIALASSFQRLVCLKTLLHARYLTGDRWFFGGVGISVRRPRVERMVSSKRVASLCFLSVSNFVQGQERDTTGSPCAYIYVGSIARECSDMHPWLQLECQWSTDRPIFRIVISCISRAIFFFYRLSPFSRFLLREEDSFFPGKRQSVKMAMCLLSNGGARLVSLRDVGELVHDDPFWQRNDHDAGTHVPILRLPYAESSISRLGALPSSS